MAEYRSTDLEKSTAQHIDRTYSDDSKDTDTAEQDARINALTPEEQKKLLRKIDIRLVGILGLMYCVSLMDRTNLGIAVVGGMGVDMMLINNRYSIITLVFFVTYVLLQPPATVILRKVGPRSFLPAIVILWGITILGFAFVTNWIQLIPLRLVLGVFEAGFFPGAAYLLSCWYCRYDLQKRNAVFYLIGSLSSAFSGIMSYGFYKMGGLGDLGPKYGQHYYPTKTNPARGILPGIAGWRWIFIMQGLITIVIGFLGIIYIADFPEKAAQKSKSLALKFITEKEAAYIVAKIELDRKDAIAEPFNLRKYAKGALDLKVWAFAFLFGLTTITSYSIAFFLPIILKDGMGFDVARSQCLIAPPYVCAAIWMYICAVLCDKYRLRGPFIIFNALLGLIGLPLLGFAKGNAVRYFGVFLATTSCNANIPCVMTYQANNIRGQWKRALVSATLVGAGGIGGIIGSLVFRKQDSPGYKPGIYTTMIAAGLSIIIVLLLDLKFWFANKRAANGGKPIEGLVGFRYTL